MRYEKEFRKDHPETLGETDKAFDLSNYVEWLENKLTVQRALYQLSSAHPTR